MKEKIGGGNAPLRKLTFSAMFLALALVLPFLTGQIPQIGSLLSPMHIPAFLCGLVCGPVWGAAVGFTAPLLRFLLFSMPPAAAAVPMAFELAVYGVLSGLLYRLFARRGTAAKIGGLYAALGIAMVGGRIVNALVKCAMLGLNGSGASLIVVFAELFTGTWAGIIVQFIAVPPLVLLLERYIKSPKS